MDRNLLHLPVELLEFIIDYSTPEGFESLTTSCKALHTICKRRLSPYNALRRQYRTFRYGLKDPAFPYRILTAFHLLARIISEPAVARYIVHADFTIDSRHFLWPKESYDMNIREDHYLALPSLISASPHAFEVDLDTEALSASILADVTQLKYSQLAATFLLSLLPNLESLVLPERWKLTETSSRLLDVVVRRAINKSQRSPSDASVSTPLAKLRAVSTATWPRGPFPFSSAQPFLALPELRSFSGRSIACADDDNQVKEGFSLGVSKNLTHLELISSNLASSPLKDSPLARLLAEIPGLISFRYQHSFYPGSSPGAEQRIWDAAELFELIVATFGKISGNGAGDKLEEICIEGSIGSHYHDTKVPSLRGRGRRKGRWLLGNDFPNLKALTLPLGFVTVPLRSGATTEDGPETDKTEIGADEEGNAWLEFVPASVERLSFSGPQGTKDGQKEELEQSFRRFAGNRKLLPNLIELRVTYVFNAAEEYKAGWKDLEAYCENEGLEFHGH